jgi:hypothetical protein
MWEIKCLKPMLYVENFVDPFLNITNFISARGLHHSSSARFARTCFLIRISFTESRNAGYRPRHRLAMDKVLIKVINFRERNARLF